MHKRQTAIGLLPILTCFVLLSGLMITRIISLNAAERFRDWEGHKSDWHGFQKSDFEIQGHACHIVFPEHPATSRPWVLRARFPNWHIEIDSMLLNKGCHIAYIDVVDQYGDEKAIQRWDLLYSHMISRGFNNKVVLEGVSRGGLICYNWARRNPEKIACMYLEAPVCDIKSWPGGRGKGVGSAKDWEKLMIAYEMTEEQLLAFDNNPIDNLKPLALAKIPVLHSIGLRDRVVPPEENTFILMERYISLGGPFAICPQTLGEQTLQGHHFPIDDPEYIVDFILSNLK
jgi:sialidase-1